MGRFKFIWRGGMPKFEGMQFNFFSRLHSGRRAVMVGGVPDERRVALGKFANFAGGGKSELHRARCRVTKAPALCRRWPRAYAGGIAARHLGGKCHRKQTVRIYSDKGEKVG